MGLLLQEEEESITRITNVKSNPYTPLEYERENERQRDIYGLLGGHHGWGLGWFEDERVAAAERRERESFASNTARELWDRVKDLVYTESSTRVSRGIIWDLFGFRFMLHSATGLDNLTPDNSILLLLHSFYSNLWALFYLVASSDDQ